MKGCSRDPVHLLRLFQQEMPFPAPALFSWWACTQVPVLSSPCCPQQACLCPFLSLANLPKYAQTTHNQLPLRKQQRYDNDSQALSTIHLYMMVLVRDGWVHGRRRESVYECMYERVRKQTKNHLILRQLSWWLRSCQWVTGELGYCFLKLSRNVWEVRGEQKFLDSLVYLEFSTNIPFCVEELA